MRVMGVADRQSAINTAEDDEYGPIGQHQRSEEWRVVGRTVCPAKWVCQLTV
jgi:hypothetical protein